MKTKLERVAEKATSDHRVKFTSLAHLLTPEFLAETWQKVNKRGAAGVDRETIEEFQNNLQDRIMSLC